MFIILIIAVVLSVSIILSFYFHKDDNIPLKYEDISTFEMQELFKNNRHYMLLSGNYLKSSSLVINKIKEEFHDGDVTLKLYTSIPDDIHDSSFIYPVEIDKDVNRILFGDEKKVIWIRSDNPVFQ